MLQLLLLLLLELLELVLVHQQKLLRLTRLQLLLNGPDGGVDARVAVLRSLKLAKQKRSRGRLRQRRGRDRLSLTAGGHRRGVALRSHRRLLRQQTRGARRLKKLVERVKLLLGLQQALGNRLCSPFQRAVVCGALRSVVNVQSSETGQKHLRYVRGVLKA